MQGIEYQSLAMRTTRDEWRDKGLWDQKIHAVMGLNSEAGEIAGIIQKSYQGHEIDLKHLEKEVGDCLWFIAEICDSFGFDMDKVMQMNIDKLIARYPNGFEEIRSTHREEGDI